MVEKVDVKELMDRLNKLESENKGLKEEVERKGKGGGRKEEIWKLLISGRYSCKEIGDLVERSKDGSRMNERNVSCVISYLNDDIKSGKKMVDGKRVVGLYKNSLKKYCLEFED